MRTFSIKVNNKIWTLSALTKEEAIQQIQTHYYNKNKVNVSWVMAF
jgi:hypothetical protein